MFGPENYIEKSKKEKDDKYFDHLRGFDKHNYNMIFWC